MAGMTLGGLASGMDTNTIITQLMQIEAQSQTRVLGRQYRSEATKTLLDQVATKLRSLKTASEELRSSGTWTNVQTVASSDAARVGARFTSGAAVGSTTLEVLQLARADQRFYSHPSTTGAATQIDFGGGVTVDVPAGATKEQTAALINGKADAPAYASVVGDDLVLSGKKTGVALTVTSSVLTEDPDKRRAERPAKVVIDNVVPPAEFATNTITTAIPGVELTLKGVTQAPLTIDVGAPGPDREALKKKVTAFVDAYNSTIDLIKSKTEEQTVRAPTTKADYGKGAMRGDPGLTGLLSRMRQTASATFEGDPLAKNADGFNQLFDIGISVPDSAGDKDMRLAGKLVIDADRLDAAITSNPGAVKRLFGGDSGVPGVAQAFAGLLDPVSKVTDGDLAKRAANTDRETARLKDQMTQMDARLKLKEERLRKQFTAMETALASTQSTTSWLSGQINGLTSLSS